MLILQLLVNGVVSGAIYAMMALGFAIIYQSTRIFHLAHGAVFTLAAYTLYLASRVLHLSFVPAIGMALVASVLLGLAIELWGYRPLRRRKVGEATFLIASLGIFIFVENGLILAFGASPLLITDAPLKAYKLGPVVVTGLHLAVICCSVVIFTVIQLLLTKTQAGKQIRALSDNPELAVALGFEASRLYLLISVMGASLAAVAGVLVALDVGATPIMGWDAVLVAAVAVIVGGVGYLPGAGVAALLVGLIHNLSVIKISPQWQSTLTFGILLVFLVFRPKGIFARAASQRGA